MISKTPASAGVFFASEDLFQITATALIARFGIPLWKVLLQEVLHDAALWLASNPQSGVAIDAESDDPRRHGRVGPGGGERLSHVIDPDGQGRGAAKLSSPEGRVIIKAHPSGRNQIAVES